MVWSALLVFLADDEMVTWMGVTYLLYSAVSGPFFKRLFLLLFLVLGCCDIVVEDFYLKYLCDHCYVGGDDLHASYCVHVA